jgi:hypothetical protein
MPPLIHRDLLPRDLEDPILAEVNQRLKELYEGVNTALGYRGAIKLANDVDLGGKRIKNVGAAQHVDDALSTTSANPLYSTAQQQKAMEALGSFMLQTARRLNDGSQQHKISSDLNLQGSVPPSNITGSLTFTSVAGSSITFVWTGIIIQLADLSYVGIKNGTLTVTGLSNVLYNFYPYYDTQLGILSFVPDSVNGVGASLVVFLTGGGHVAENTAAAQRQTADGRIALTNGAGQATINGTPGSFGLRSR